MNAWQHLPNASLIDWVIASVKVNPEKWATAQDAILDAILNAAYDAARNAILNAAYDAARDAALSATWDAACDATWDAAWNAALNATRYPILALIAYDDCDQYLSMSYEQLLTYAVLSERPQAVLLLPLKCVQENECLATLA